MSQPSRPAPAQPRASCACTACRLSKVRCDRSATNQRCSRCTRLGLVCQLAGISKRGSKNVQRDIARLGPAVRSLLQSENPQAPSGGVAASLQKDSYGYDDTPMQWKGPRCPSMIMAHIEGAAGRMALLKHWLFIALRSRSCATVRARAPARLLLHPRPPRPLPPRRCAALPCSADSARVIILPRDLVAPRRAADGLH